MYLVNIQTVLLLILLVFIAVLYIKTIKNDNKQDDSNLIKAQTELASRIIQVAENQDKMQRNFSEKMQSQEVSILKTLEERLSDITRRIGDSLQKTSEKTNETLQKSYQESTKTIYQLQERLARIDEAQKNITTLSEQMVNLQKVLDNKQARGAFGEVQLHDLVSSILPPFAYDFQVKLENGKRADCLLRLPNPPGAIVVDAKFPLESYHMLRNAEDEQTTKLAIASFKADILKHVTDISNKYIISGETADSALMFLPSEAVYAELHANFQDVVEKSFKQKVWIVSPTTLMATLNTVRAILKDAKMREQAGLIQKEVTILLEDMVRLDKRVDNLSKHFDQATRDVKDIRVSTDKVIKKSKKIESMELKSEEEIEEIPNQTNKIEQL